MNFCEKLKNIQKKNNSLLCIGLDTDIDKIPKFLLKEEDPIFAFNKKIIDATIDIACAYKLNSAFYEAYDFNSLKKTRDYIPIPVILDAKRGDIGNTSKMYARMAFDLFNFDAITVNPYMGYDSIEPFINYKDKFTFVLCLTSNPGAEDFQLPNLYLRVAESVNKWNKYNNLGLVVGATKSNLLKNIREVAKDLLLLIPGIGAQGGDLVETIKYGGENLIINAARSIIYASTDEDFDKKAREEAIKLRDEINRCRKNI